MEYWSIYLQTNPFAVHKQKRTGTIFDHFNGLALKRLTLSRNISVREKNDLILVYWFTFNVTLRKTITHIRVFPYIQKKPNAENLNRSIYIVLWNIEHEWRKSRFSNPRRKFGSHMVFNKLEQKKKRSRWPKAHAWDILTGSFK